MLKRFLVVLDENWKMWRVKNDKNGWFEHSKRQKNGSIITSAYKYAWLEVVGSKIQLYEFS